MENYTAEILLLDDEAESLELSRRTITRFVQEASVHTASTVEEAMDILKTERIELAFLDVELKSSDGFSFCQYIHRAYPAVKVVFLTGHVDYGAKSYDFEPFDFLVKPVDAVRLERTFSRFAGQRKEREKDAAKLVIETGTGFALLRTDEILYIVKEGNLCMVSCTDGQTHRVSYTLDKLEAMLAGQDFFRIHQSYLVPVSRIRQVNLTAFGTSYEARLDDGSVVPVSRKKYSNLKDFILQRSMRI